MPVPRAELASLTSVLEDLTRRVSAFADTAHQEKQEELATELFAVERSLRGATRRLTRVSAGR